MGIALASNIGGMTSPIRYDPLPISLLSPVPPQLAAAR